MNIGIDIDDTLTNTNEATSVFASKYESEHPDAKLNLHKLVTGILDTKELEDFYITHSKEICNIATIKEDAKNVIEKLREEGNKIFVITARSDKYFDNADKYVEDYLRRNEIEFDKIITAQEDKLKACKDENIDFMFDDKISTIETLNQNNIKGAVFTSSLNKEIETSSDRVSSWTELYNYIHQKEN